MRALRSLALLALVGTLCGCGKAGAPLAPGSNFPRPYPDPKLAPTAPAYAPPEDQAGLQAGSKAKFTQQGSYIDPAVRATELSRSAVAPGSTLPYAQTRSSDGTSSPFTQGLGGQGQGPLPQIPGTTDNGPAEPQ